MELRRLTFALMALLIACSEIDYPQEFPIVLTDEVINNSPEGAEFVGSIRSLGKNQQVLSYGFIWSQTEDFSQDSSHWALTDPAREGRFSKKVNIGLIKGAEYYVRAFMETSTGTVYGNTLSFISKGSLPPVINNFFPKEGFDGTEITIVGKNFSHNPSTNQVSLNGISCRVMTATDSILKVQLPGSALVGDFKIEINIATNKTVSEEEFSILGPRIHSLSRLSGRVGDKVEAEGEYFDTAPGLTVLLGGDPWPAPGFNYSKTIEVSPNHLTFFVPDNQNYKGPVLLRSYSEGGEKQYLYPENFTVLNSWSKLSDRIPIVNYEGYISVMIGHSIWVVGGTRLYEYNTGSETWTRKTDFPGANRFFGTAFVYHDKLYYGFGMGYHEGTTYYNGQFYNDLWEFDPAQNTWRHAADVPIPARAKMLSMAIGDKIYLGFGYGEKPFQDFWAYDLSSNTCSALESPVWRVYREPSSFVLDGKGYVLGLESQGTNSTPERDVWEFDPSEESWTRKKDSPRTINEAGTTLRNGAGLIVIYDGKNDLCQVYEYDPGNDLWIPRQSLQVSDLGNFVFSHYINKKLYFGTKRLWVMDFD